jgi:hypothetical protein
VIPLLLLLRAKALQALNAIEHTRALIGGHVIETAESVEPVLLNLGRKFAKSGLILESALEVRKRQVSVVLHPLFEVLLALRSVGSRSSTHGRALLSGPGFGAGLGTLCSGSSMILLSVFLSKAAGEDRRSCKQHEDCRAEREPG